MTVTWNDDRTTSHAIALRDDPEASHYERMSHTALCGLPSGRYQYPSNGSALVCPTCEALAAPVRHRITERADGPSLDDLVRLIEFLRANRVGHEIVSMGSWTDGDDYDPGWMQLLWTHGKIRHSAVERQALAEAFYVGPDGAVYDANGEAL